MHYQKAQKILWVYNKIQILIFNKIVIFYNLRHCYCMQYCIICTKII